jgi:hypothetical protein
LDDTLHAPLLDRGKGKNCMLNNDQSLQLPGDVIADRAHTTNRKHPHEQEELAQLADQSTPTQQPYGSLMGLNTPNIPKRAVATTNKAQLVDGLLLPTLDTTFLTRVGKEHQQPTFAKQTMTTCLAGATREGDIVDNPHGHHGPPVPNIASPKMER